MLDNNFRHAINGFFATTHLSHNGLLDLKSANANMILRVVLKNNQGIRNLKCSSNKNQ
jgi:hypothetical protein